MKSYFSICLQLSQFTTHCTNHWDSMVVCSDKGFLHRIKVNFILTLFVDANFIKFIQTQKFYTTTFVNFDFKLYNLFPWENLTNLLGSSRVHLYWITFTRIWSICFMKSEEKLFLLWHISLYDSQSFVSIPFVFENIVRIKGRKVIKMLKFSKIIFFSSMF